MHRLLWIGSLLLVTGSAVGYFADRWLERRAEAEQTELAAEPAVIDLGERAPGSEEEATFRLRNPTRSSIEIVQVVQTCQCGELHVSKSLLAPGEESEIRVHWRIGKTRGRRGLEVPVLYRRLALAEGSVPAEQIVTLRLLSDVQGDIRYSPRELRFTAGQDETQTLELEFRSNRFRVTKAEGNHPSLEVERPGRTILRVHFKSRAYAPSVIDDTAILLTTDNPEESTIRIPVVIRAGDE